MADAMREQANEDIFALDIGTRSIIGLVGRVEGRRFHVLAIEKQNHGQRAMLDGQIENIAQVADVVRDVVRRLESQTKMRLRRVCVAAAGRALKSESASFRLVLPGVQQLTEENISELEAGAVAEAEKSLTEQSGQQGDQYYMVGYTVSSYRLDGYPMSSIKDHSGREVEADVVATFLPREVVESLYAVVEKVGLEVASLTLEPIASLNAAIPADIRLLNLALVDIGAGTSDIAICRDGSVVGYTMATVAGDEVTELLMRQLLVDFATGEELKFSMAKEKPMSYMDILGLKHDITPEELAAVIEPTVKDLAQELSRRILDLNGKMPSAVFLAGGGSKLAGLREAVADALGIESTRVAVAGRHFEKNAYADQYDLNDPEYATPLGIAVSAGLGLINDSYVILLNGEPAKLFRSGILILRDILLMNGYHYGDLIGKTGANLTFNFNGQRQFFRGALATPPVIRLNGEEASLTDVVHAGDSIEFIPAQPGGDARRRLRDILGDRFEGVITLNGAVATLDDYVHTGDEVWVDPAKQSGKREEAAPADSAQAPVKAEGKLLHITLNGETLDLPEKSDGEAYYLMDLLKYTDLDFDHLSKPVELVVNGVPGQFAQKLSENDDVEIG